MNRFALISGAVLCAASVALGAFGAHAISSMVTPQRLATWDTAARYLFNHGIGLLVIGLLAQVLKTPFKRVGILIFSGICVFSGSLFVLVLTNTPWLGAIAPIGGILMIAGWIDLTQTLILKKYET